MRNLLERTKKHRSLIENFGYLSALQGFNLLFPLLTYPYLIRVLEAEAYGKVTFAQGIVAYCAVLVHFGFQSSAPRDVAVLRNDRTALSELVSSIFAAKFLLCLVALLGFVALVHVVPALARDKWLYLISFGGAATPLLFPEWYFQGIEKMRNITIIQFGVRVLVVVGIFAFVHEPRDYLLFAGLNSVGAVAGGLAGVAVLVSHGLRLTIPPWHRIREAMDRSSPLFLANVFASLADKGGTLVVGAALGPVPLAYYNLGEKLTSFASTIFYNVGRTIYPNLAQSRNKALSRKLTRLVLLAGLAGSVLLWAGAPVVIRVLGGPGMEPAVPILRLMSPYVFLAAMGPLLANVLLIEDHHRDMLPNTVIAGAFYVASLSAAWAMGITTASTVALAFVAAIVVRNGHRYAMVRRHGLTDWFHGA